VKHVHVKDGFKQIEWECDCCHDRFLHIRKPPTRCDACGRDLCKHCKRHIHIEIGSGNGKPIPEQANTTKNYCPEHFAVAVQPVLTVLEVDRG
jgi:hypothetical protein